MKRGIRTVTNYPLRQRPGLIGRRVVSRTLSALGLKHPWVVQRYNPAPPDLLDDFRLFAIIGTWMEADVIEATVKNAFTQGCDRVFLVDNDSPDDTVDRAIVAGAEIAGSFSTRNYDELLRVRLMNDAVDEISAADGSDHIWWLWLDADLFPHGPRGLTLREYLATLDRSFRIVGARFMNHYPGDEPHYLSGFHPLDFQPLCEELSFRTCWHWHRTHPLRRFDRDRPRIWSDIGLHRAYSAEQPLFEPGEAIFDHHFPFRRKEVTFRRLQASFSATEGSTSRVDPDDYAGEHMVVRLRSLEAVYAHDWRSVEMELAGGCRRPRVEPLPWAELVEPEHVPVKRWYPEKPVEPLDGLAARAGEAR
jgi:glycosyltransferase involved in cell wall biosynthesis